tara:strand:- start:167 stop:439 length:273 start_codon:yes stop_codon:yes gene_type:complete
MIVGARRVEEAKVFDGDAGYHQFHTEDGTPYGSFEVFWCDANGEIIDGMAIEQTKPGWYWWACSPGCTPDGEPNGPFGSSQAARADAEEI